MIIGWIVKAAVGAAIAKVVHDIADLEMPPTPQQIRDGNPGGFRH